LPIETRLNALQLILGGENPNEDYWYVENNTFSENKGFIVNYLISKTPQADQLSLISNGIRSNNYQWLRNLWNEYNTLTNDVELEHLGDLFTNITSMLVTTIGKLDVQPQLADIEVYPSLASGPVIKTIRPGLDRAFLIGLKNGKEMGGFVTR
jgi:hypothetical protein